MKQFKIIICAVLKFAVAVTLLFAFMVGSMIGANWLKTEHPDIAFAVFVGLCVVVLAPIFYACYMTCRQD